MSTDEKKQIERFLTQYKKVVRQFEGALTATDIVDVLCIVTGGNVLPNILFHENGRLRTFDQLKSIADQQLRLLIKQNSNSSSISFLLLVNIAKDEKLLQQWTNLLASEERSDTKQWFTDTFKTAPSSSTIIRSVLMREHITDLRFYLTKNREPREDVALLLRQIRKHYPPLTQPVKHHPLV